ncbi:MAG: tetratricopeptide repeat protein [Pyrinomonadaceae bacterium]|nr:tetratricopeptide repeat protein [Pyrinomonadaceae bacterium]
MYKNFAVLTIFLAILSHSKAAAGQNMTSVPPADAIVEAHDSITSNKTESKTEVSPQASAEAKRLYKEAVKYRRGGLSKQASQLFEKALQLNPNYADAHYDLGYAYFDQGRWEDAIRSFENAIRIDPKDKKTRAGLYEARVRVGRNPEPDQYTEEKIAAGQAISTNAWAESRSRNVTPVGVASISVAPSNVAPSSGAPSTVAPSKVAPPNSVPPSVAPSTVAASKIAPPNVVPLRVAPSTVAPSTVAPSTVAPPGSVPPSVAPSTVAASSVPASLGIPTDAIPDNSKSASTARDDLTRVYRIGIGDVLDVRLGNEATTQSTLFTVTPSGLLEHPILAAPLQVSGLTVEETRTRLEADLKRRAVNENPRVLVGIREYLSHAIIVSGLVKEPGTKLLRREAIPLYVVIADAQPAPEAGRATLIRHETGDVMIIDLSKPMQMNLLVRSGDVITVQASPKQFFYVGGEVKAPGEIQFRPGLTLTQAILTAGGLSRAARNAQIARASDKGFLASTRYKLKDINTGKLEDPLIQPGDRITVEH